MLRDLSCPTCGGPGLEAHQPDGVVTCKFCGNKFATDNQVACPYCEAINSPEAGFCKACGEKLKRSCPACGATNWAGADYCLTCGRNLDALEAMTNRHRQGFKGTLQQQREIAGALKAEEEADSQKRLATMWAAEARRQEEIARQQAEQKRQQTLIIFLALGFGVIVACLVLAFAFYRFYVSAPK